MNGRATGAPDGPRTGVVPREAIAHAFLSEYHRLLADALPGVLPDSGPASTPGALVAGTAGSGASLRQRAFAWRVTAARIPLVPEARWPTWLLDHLHAAAATPGVGAEYRRQYALLLDLLGPAAPRGCPPA